MTRAVAPTLIVFGRIDSLAHTLTWAAEGVGPVPWTVHLYRDGYWDPVLVEICWDGDRLPVFSVPSDVSGTDDMMDRAIRLIRLVLHGLFVDQGLADEIRVILDGEIIDPSAAADGGQ